MNFSRSSGPERQWAQAVYGRAVSHGPAMVVAAATVLLSGRLFRLISRYAVNLFFWDEWDNKTATLFQKNSLWEMFTWQRGWHRLGMGALVEKALDPLFQWNSRSESFILGGIVGVAAICALWLKIRLYGRLSVWDIAIPAIFFTPAQWETLYMTPIFSQGPLPFLLIVLYCLAFTCKRTVLRYPLILLLNFATIYTGFGIFLGVLTPVLLSLDYRSQPPSQRLPKAYFAIILLLSLVSLGLFFKGYIPTAGIGCYSRFQQSSVSGYVGFLALIAANFLALTGQGFFPLAVGLIVFIAIFVSLVGSVSWPLRREHEDTSQFERAKPVVVAALTGVSVMACLVIAYVRLCAGLQAAEAPRYTIYVQIGILGLYFHLISIRQSSSRRSLMTVLMISILIACLHSNRQAMVQIRDGKQRWKTCYLQMENIDRCNQVAGFLIYPLPGENKRLDEKRQRLSLPQKLEYLKRTRQNLYLDAKRP